MLGKLVDIEPNGSIAVISLEINNRIRRLFAETELFLIAIYQAFRNNWKGQTIDFDVTPYGLISSFSTIPDRLLPIGPFRVNEKDDNDTYELTDIGMSKNPYVISSIVWVYCKKNLIVGIVYKGKITDDVNDTGLPVFKPDKKV